MYIHPFLAVLSKMPSNYLVFKYSNSDCWSFFIDPLIPSCSIFNEVTDKQHSNWESYLCVYSDLVTKHHLITALFVFQLRKSDVQKYKQGPYSVLSHTCKRFRCCEWKAVLKSPKNYFIPKASVSLCGQPFSGLNSTTDLIH